MSINDGIMVTTKTGSSMLATLRAHHEAGLSLTFLGREWKVSSIRPDSLAQMLTLVWLKAVTS